MSVLKLPLKFIGEKGEKNLYSLFDSGASLSCINPDYLEGLASPIKMGKPRIISTASEGHFIEVKEWVLLEFFVDDVLLSDEFLLVPGLSEEAIIGAASLQKWRIKLNFDTDKVEVDPKVAKMQLKALA
jgi:predicted aspartyl protease